MSNTGLLRAVAEWAAAAGAHTPYTAAVRMLG